MATHLPPQWRERVLAIVNSRGWNTGSFHPEAMRLLLAWQRCEGGTAQWNPLNTTSPLPGSTDFNTVGVQNYAKATHGPCATAITLVNGRYNGILGWLQAPQITAEEMVTRERDEFQTWGTDPDLILQVLSEL